jgi:hypothetical protein
LFAEADEARMLAMAGPAQSDIEFTGDRPSFDRDDAIGQQQRLVDIEQRRDAMGAPQAEQLLLRRRYAKGSTCVERLVREGP